MALSVTLGSLLVACTLIPPLPKQTPGQASAVQRAKMSAANHAPVGVAELRGMLNSTVFVSWLHEFDDGSLLHELDADELLRRMEAELFAAELVHSFGVGNGKDGNCGMDVSLASGPNQPYFYNQWLLQALGFMPVDPAENTFAEGSETHFFGFAPFADVSAPDLNTSADRPVYAALNMYRIAAGNPQCGPVAAVLSRTYIGDEAIAAPVDTGNYWATCGQGQSTGPVLPGININCSAWQPEHSQLGVPSSLLYLLPAYTRFYNETSVVAGQASAEFNLARLVVRLLSRLTYRTRPEALAKNKQFDEDTEADKIAQGTRTEAKGTSSPWQRAPLRLNFFENTWGYIEVNPAVTVAQPGGIKMLVGTFDNWFGTGDGDALRHWCVARGWPLAWAHDPIDSTWDCSVNTTGGCQLPPRWTYTHGIEPANTRLLDPYVLQRVSHGRNSSGGAMADAAFAARWDAVNRTVPSNATRGERRVALDRQWGLLLGGSGGLVGLSGSLLAIEPLYAGACADEACVGVRIADGACVCPLPVAPGLL